MLLSTHFATLSRQRFSPTEYGFPAHYRSLKTRLEAYYSLISPETIANPAEWRSKFDQIFEKYGGSYDGERKLGSKLAKKYGAAVRLLVAQQPSAIQCAEFPGLPDRSLDGECHVQSGHFPAG